MDESKIYTRVYSETSAGKLSSGKGPIGDALTHVELLKEFRNHAESGSPEPTALISVSNRIIDTVKRAFEKYYTYHESPADIWIAFIRVPATVHESPTSVHAARPLAEECGLSRPNKFQHEYVFEWVIPDEFVLHQVSLQTLIDRGLDWTKYLFLPNGRVVSTLELRKRVAVDLRPRRGYGPWDIGAYLALFARKFGARAPLNWVVDQLYYDCTRTDILEEDVVRVTYPCGSSEIVDFDFFFNLDGEIETGLYDEWLEGLGFYLSLQEFEGWQDMMEDRILQDQIELWDSWHHLDCDEPSERETLLRNKAWDKLSAKHEEIRSAIEAEAVKLGL